MSDTESERLAAAVQRPGDLGGPPAAPATPEPEPEWLPAGPPPPGGSDPTAPRVELDPDALARDVPRS